MTNKRECQNGMSSRLRGIEVEAMGGKGCADPKNWQWCWRSVKVVHECGC